MRLKRIFLIISLAMLAIATVFLILVLNHPEWGKAFYIGDLMIGAAVWRAFYLCYLVIMLALFVASFLIKRKK